MGLKERKYADYDYRMKQFEERKRFLFSAYEVGLGIDGEENCKGNISKSYAWAAMPIPSSYRDEFLEYLKEDKKFLALLGQKKSSSSHNDEDEIITKLKNKLYERREDGIESVVGYVCNVLLNKQRRDLIKPYLTEEELNLCTEFYKYKKDLLNAAEEKNHTDFIKYLRTWYVETNYKAKREVLYYLWNEKDLIDREEYDEIKVYKPEKNAEKIDSESSTVSDIKAKLEKLKSLKEDGLISEEDFQKKKSELLDLI